VTITLSNVVDVTATLTPGTPLSVSLPTPGQNARLFFTATAGQRVSVNFTNSTFPNCNNFSQGAYATIYDSNNVAVSTTTCVSSSGFIEPVQLAGGNYTLVFDPYWWNTGSVTITLYNVVDVTGSITPGSPVNISTPTPGQNIRLTFSGTAGQQVSAVLNSTYNQGYWPVTLSILKPDGTTLGANTPEVGGHAFVDSTTLPVTGVYTVVVDPGGAMTGNGTLGVYLFTDLTGTINIGSQVSIPTSIPGQNVRYTFSGTAGQQVTAVLNSTYNQGYWPVTLSIVKPDGTTLGANTPELGGNTSVGSLTLPTSGMYTVLIDPRDSNTGSGTVTLTSP